MPKTKKSKKPTRQSQLTPDVRDQRRLIASFLNKLCENGKKVGTATCGVYAFFDFEGAAIYVGQTKERVSTRIGRHMTNWRTDAVAMKVLDPAEVAEIRVWPFWELHTMPAGKNEKAWAQERSETLDAAEWTLFKQLQAQQGDAIGILNEKSPPKRKTIKLPKCYEGSIVEPNSLKRLNHPDERIARRASTIASLAQIVKERDVALGLRRTLMNQADRLHRLAKRRFNQLVKATPADKAEHELVGNEAEDIGVTGPASA